MANVSLTTRDVARELARRYSTMTHEELDLLESILVPMKFAKNEMVLKEGEVCTNIYWVVRGLVRQFYFKNDKELTEYMATENSIVMCIESLFHEVPSQESLILSQHHADMLRFESAQDRYQKLVKNQPQLVLRAPLVYIASYLQMTPETLSRVRTAALMEK